MTHTREIPIARAIRAIDRFGGWVDQALQIVMVLVLAAIFVLMFSQVLLRYIIFIPVPWIEEGAAMLLPILAVWGSAICLRHGSHLQVDFILAKMTDTLRLTLVVAMNLMIVYLAFKICQAGLTLAELGKNERTTSGSISLYWPRLSMVAGGLLLMLQAAILALKDTARLIGWLPIREERTRAS